MNPPLRVLHIHAGNLYGGVETVLVTLARARSLVPEMEPAFALCFDGRLATELAALGCPPHPLPAVRVSRPWTVLRARRALAQHLAGHPTDVVICHAPWTHAVFGAAVRRAGVPLVFWQHGPSGSGHWLERWARRTPPDFAVCTSQFTAGSLAALFDTPHAVVHPPVTRPRAPATESRARLRTETGTPADAVVIAQLSRMEDWKGHTTLFAALARLVAQPDWHCWIVGGAQRPAERVYLASLHADAARLGIAPRVHFLGERSDVPAVLAAADLFCQPNTAPEPFGIVFVEALYAGLPVVTSALGGAAEIVDATCGVLVPRGDAAELSNVIARLVGDIASRRRLGAAGPARAALLCDPARQLQRLAASLRAYARPGAP